MLRRRNSGGFTLIEIILVMAIAGLILAMVFVALAGAQRGRRDGERKADLGRLTQQIESYATNHSGLYPASMAGPDFGSGGTYTPANFLDPSSQTNYFSIGSGAPGYLTYALASGTACDGSTSLGGRQYAVRMTLEAGTACLDNR
jgi:prepilin-type N-terminal cleavage/methylation domain-containing protein